MDSVYLPYSESMPIPLSAAAISELQYHHIQQHVRYL